MGRVTILALRVVIALSITGALFVQVWLMPVVWTDLENAGTPLWGRIALITIFVLVILTMQVGAVCIWQLLSMVRTGAVFSEGAFRYVDIIVGATAAASVLVFVLAVLLAPGGTAPGIVGLICGAALVIAGVALVVLVLRMLLRQAVDRDVEASRLRSELDEVI